MPISPALAAVCLSVLLGALGLFQLSLAAGAPLGRLAWGGGHRVLPRALRIGSLVSILIYALLALIVLDRAGLVLWLPPGFAVVLAWVVAGYFGLGIGLNLASRSPPERAVMSPIAAILCGLTVIVALG